MPFVMNVRQFFEARDSALRMCSDIVLIRELGRHTPRIPESDPCRKSVLDLSNRLIFDVGSGRRVPVEKMARGEELLPPLPRLIKPATSGRELNFLDPSVSFDDVLSFSSLELIKASITTNGKVCGKFKRDLKQSLDKLKDEKIEKYTQCLRGLDNLKQELEVYRKE